MPPLRNARNAARMPRLTRAHQAVARATDWEAMWRAATAWVASNAHVTFELSSGRQRRVTAGDLRASLSLRCWAPSAFLAPDGDGEYWRLEHMQDEHPQLLPLLEAQGVAATRDADCATARRVAQECAQRARDAAEQAEAARNTAIVLLLQDTGIAQAAATAARAAATLV